jgi:hypothetical protein
LAASPLSKVRGAQPDLLKHVGSTNPATNLSGFDFMGPDSIIRIMNNTLVKSNLSASFPYFHAVASLPTIYNRPMFPVAIQGTELVFFVYLDTASSNFVTVQADMGGSTIGSKRNLINQEPSEGLLLEFRAEKTPIFAFKDQYFSLDSTRNPPAIFEN